MIEVLRSNDAVLLSFVTHVLSEAGVDAMVADQHVSIMEGSIGAFPRRILVAAADESTARAALIDAGLATHLVDETR